MPCATPCPNCDRTGLPILFTRYAAAYSAQAEGMALLKKLQPTGKLQSRPGGVALKTALYSLRMLRPGYLYVRIEYPHQIPEWTGYAVHPHGYLSAFDVKYPQDVKPNPACEVEIRGAMKSMVWVRDAKRVSSLHYLFHPDPLDSAHLEKVIEPNLDKYAQSFDVKGWVNGKTSQDDTCQPGQLDKQVLEFAALKWPGLDVQKVGNDQHFGLMGGTPQEREWGRYDIQIDRHFAETPGGAATALVIESHTETILQLPYATVHGPRLKKMAEHLREKGGAVIACEDPIGIAQELSLHHLTAAVPYVDWLQETDSKGVSNQWKQAASESVRTIRSALAKKTVQAYDDATDRLRNTQEILSGNYPGSESTQPVRLRRPDGSYEEISVQELNRRRREDLEGRIGSRESDRAVLGTQAATADARAKTEVYCDMEAIAAFDRLHESKLKARDDLMDLLAADLQGWLKADALVDRALGRYSDKPGTETGDGIRCAGQLCAILLQIDSAPKGRQWYATLDLFAPDKKNLVWRMLSLNNAGISQELQAALALLTGALPPAGIEVQDAEERARHQKAYATVVAALGQMSKTLSAADKINKELATAGDANAKTGARVQAALQIGKIMKDSPHAVLATAVVARFKALPVAKAEALIAKAQVLLLAQGLGKQAVAFAKKQEANALTKTAAKQARYTQRRIEKALKGQIAEVAGQGMRLPTVLLGLNALAILPALANAKTKGDERTTTELLGTMAGLVGSMRQWRADLYEKAVFKQVPELVHKTYRAGTATATEAELLGLKAGAARFVVAGAVVGVAWDAVDGVTAGREKQWMLSVAYWGRVGTGSATVFGVVASARYATAPLWLVRFNLVTAVASGVLTVAIGKLKGDAWANWLQAQPFRKAESKKLPHESEKETMGKLADALAEME